MLIWGWRHFSPLQCSVSMKPSDFPTDDSCVCSGNVCVFLSHTNGHISTYKCIIYFILCFLNMYKQIHTYMCVCASHMYLFHLIEEFGIYSSCFIHVTYLLQSNHFHVFDSINYFNMWNDDTIVTLYLLLLSVRELDRCAHFEGCFSYNYIFYDWYFCVIFCNLEDFLLIWPCLSSLTFLSVYVLLVIFSREYFIKKNYSANKGNENPNGYCVRIELYHYPWSILSYKQNEEPDLKY